MTDGEVYENLVAEYQSLLINYFATEFNYELFRIWISALIDGSGIFYLGDLLNVDLMEGANLDFIGENIVGINRACDVRYDSEGAAYSILTDPEYRVIIKIALLFKNIKCTIPAIQRALLFVCGEGAYVKESNLALDYIFDSTLIDRFLAQTIIQKRILPKPQAIPIKVYILENGQKFFNFPAYYNDAGVAVYNVFDAAQGLVYGNPVY